MFGWFKTPAARASCSNRRRRSASAEREVGRTLIATSRPSRVSRARYTSPMPPVPRGETTSYGPRRLPAEIVIPFAVAPSGIRGGGLAAVAGREELAADDRAQMPFPGDAFANQTNFEDSRGQHAVAKLQVQPAGSDDVGPD